MSTTTTTTTKTVLPVPGERNILVTSALPYVNNVPHLGNIIGAVLSADVYSRYCRQRGYNTLYICGTDEYGTATETKALEEGISCEEICAKYHKLHAEVYEWFDIAFDYFGRTSTPLQTTIAQHIFKKLHANGLCFEESSEQLYDAKVGKFLADRFVIGTCPLCGYEDARGDQCDRCGKLLNPLELINARSKLSNEKPEKRSTKHLYADLPTIQPKLQDWVEKAIATGNWTSIAQTITNSWLKEGVKPRCITRDLQWGIPVPLAGFEGKVFYVWYDAPIGYISITANYTDQWEQWWRNPENVQLVQFMGKDNVPFHSIIFPSCLIGSGEKWTLVNSLSSTEYLNYEDGKFSKSRGIGVFGDQAKETGIPSEVWRYYLLTNRPEQADTVFSWKDLVAKVNNELLANLGNFINRILKFVNNNYQNIVPESQGESAFTEKEHTLITNVNKHLVDYNTALEHTHLKEGLHVAMGISMLGNQYLQHSKPWELFKTNPAYCGTVIHTAVQLVKLLSAIFHPYMPAFSNKVLSQLNLSLKEGEQNTIPDTFTLNLVPAGHVIGTAEPLFNKLELSLVEELRLKFSGGQKEQEKFALDLRVGQILSVDNHPTADNLYKLTVAIGPKEEDKRQIVGGLRGSYPDPASLINKKVVVVCNLKHSKIRDVKSEGMLLASKPSDTSVVLLAPSQDVPVGTAVLPEGCKLDQGIVQPKVLKQVLGFLKIGKNSLALFKDQPLFATNVVVTAEQPVAEGSIIA